MAIPQSDPSTTPAVAADGGGLSALIRDADPGRTGTASRLPISPNFPFFLVHWPTNWQVESEGLEAPTWLPYLSQHVILPGCNLNRTIRKGEPATAAYDAAVLRNVRRGATYLDVERHRLQNGSKYLKEAPCRDPRTGREGIYYLDGFTVPRDAIPGRRLRFRFDRGASNRWRLHLVASGVIRPPSRQILEEILGRKQRKLVRVQGHTNLPSEEYERRVDQAAAVVELFAGAAIPVVAAGARVGLPSSPGSVPDVNDADLGGGAEDAA